MEEELSFDYEINWDKKNHAVKWPFSLGVQNLGGIERRLMLRKCPRLRIFTLREAVLFYNPTKSRFEAEGLSSHPALRA